MNKKLFSMVSLLMIASVLAACATPTAPAPVKETVEVPVTVVVPVKETVEVPVEVVVTATPVPWSAPEGALVSVKVDAAPTLDGAGDDAVWGSATEVSIVVDKGTNTKSTTVMLKSVYSGNMVYFLATYGDPTLSEQRAPWKLGDDGVWTKLKDPNDKGGDNNVYYEDKFAMIWPINNSVPEFDTKGCATGCHVNDDTGKPYGNKYFETPGAMADLWHWKSIRNLNQIDDQYVDTMAYDKEKAPEAGRHSDPKNSGGYVDNQTEDKTLPAFGLPDNVKAPPYFILDSEKVPFDATKYVAGDEVPAIIKSMITGDRGNISASWKYADGKWTLEFGRKLLTGSEYDVQFLDMSAVYYFGVAVFDNAQVRHAFEEGSTPFVFQP